MSDYKWCHGPKCHEDKTQDRIRGSKGSKVLRTRKIKQNIDKSWYSPNNFYNYFCSNGCYNQFAHKHIERIVAIAPRHTPLETPIEDPVKTNSTGLTIYNPTNLANMIKGMKNKQSTNTREAKILARKQYESVN